MDVIVRSEAGRCGRAFCEMDVVIVLGAAPLLVVAAGAKTLLARSEGRYPDRERKIWGDTPHAPRQALRPGPAGLADDWFSARL